MKKYLFFLIGSIICVSIQANVEVTISNNIVKYNQMKKDNYLQRLIRERDKLISNRDDSRVVREHKNAKIYCCAQSQKTHTCQ